MGNNQTYKNRALKSLEGKWMEGVVATIIVFLISGISSVISIPFGENVKYGIEGLWTILTVPIGYGFSVFFLNLIRQQDISYTRLFDGYKDFGRVFLAQFLVGLIELIGFILLIVPGVIVALMFSQTVFILKDEPQLGAIEAMKRSAALMDGHKMELFVLWLSFLGWIVLGILTCGLGLLFLYPYYTTTKAHYYEDLKREQLDY